MGLGDYNGHHQRLIDTDTFNSIKPRPLNQLFLPHLFHLFQLSLLKSAHPDSSLSSSSRPTATTARQSSNSAPPVPKDLSLAQKKKMMLLKAKRERLTKELARMES